MTVIPTMVIETVEYVILQQNAWKSWFDSDINRVSIGVVAILTIVCIFTYIDKKKHWFKQHDDSDPASIAFFTFQTWKQFTSAFFFNFFKRGYFFFWKCFFFCMDSMCLFFFGCFEKKIINKRKLTKKM